MQLTKPKASNHIWELHWYTSEEELTSFKMLLRFYNWKYFKLINQTLAIISTSRVHYWWVLVYAISEDCLLVKFCAVWPRGLSSTKLVYDALLYCCKYDYPVYWLMNFHSHPLVNNLGFFVVYLTAGVINHYLAQSQLFAALSNQATCFTNTTIWLVNPENTCKQTCT